MADKKTTDKIKEIAKNVTEAAEPYVEKAKMKAGPVLEEAKKKAAPMLDEAKAKAEPALNEAMKNAQPYLDIVKEKADPVLKEVKKATEPATKAVKSIGRDITESQAKRNTKTEFYIQYKDYEVRTDDIGEKIRERYVAEGHKASDIKEMQVYLKPEENTAYYVINHQYTGKFTY